MVYHFLLALRYILLSALSASPYARLGRKSHAACTEHLSGFWCPQPRHPTYRIWDSVYQIIAARARYPHLPHLASRSRAASHILMTVHVDLLSALPPVAVSSLRSLVD
jgi:hypothetical protein